MVYAVLAVSGLKHLSTFPEMSSKLREAISVFVALALVAAMQYFATRDWHRRRDVTCDVNRAGYVPREYTEETVSHRSQ